MPREYDKKVRRLIRLYDKLNAGQVLFLPALADEFKVSLRSLQRDMAELQSLYLPIQSVERNGRTGYALAFEVNRIPVTFGLSDIITVIQRMTRKWASCSPKGRLCFATSLLAEPAAVREAAIVHELIHLIVPNHGKLFKSMLRAYLPEGEKVLQTKSNGDL